MNHHSQTRLLLIRHGSTDWNDQHRFIGKMDLPLNSRGTQQAYDLAERLISEPFEMAFTSHLRRASETARIITEVAGKRFIEDDRLTEMDFGIWEGLTLTQILEQYPEAFQSWKGDPSYAIESGESIQEVKNRVEAFINELLCNHQGKTILIVSHGMVLQMVVYLCLDIPVANDWKFYFYNGSLSEILFTTERIALVRLNDTHHITS
jgi:broad specificity phosphatase PhoE